MVRVVGAVLSVVLASGAMASQQRVKVMKADGQTTLMSVAEFTAGAVPADAAGVVPPKVIAMVPAKYTAEAMRQKVQGDVIVDVIVEPNGKVSRAMVTKSLQPDLDLNALTASLGDKFQPGTVNGKPVTVLAHTTVMFRLH